MRGKHVVDKLSRGLAGAKGKARARASSLGIHRAASAARPRFASSTPAPLSPITSSGPTTGFAATGRPDASASSRTRPKVSVKLGKHEYVGARVGGGKPLVVHFAHEMRFRKARLKLLPRRSLPNDDLRTRQIQRQKSVEILFDRHTRAGQKNRSREFEDTRGARSKEIAVYATRPTHQTNETPALSSSRSSVSVDTIMPEPALWNRRSNA